MLPKPYYVKDGVTLYCGDCLEILPQLAGIGLIFTSPPYNLGGAPWPHLGHWKPGDSPGGKSKWRNGSDGSGGVTYKSHQDTMPHDVYVKWQRSALTACWNALSDNGAIFYNHKPRVIGGRCWLPLELNPDLPLRQIVTWTRAGGMNFNPTAYVPTCEWIMIFARTAWRLRDKSASGIGNVWYVPQKRNPDHPAPFPDDLPAKAIATTRPGIVCDPFCGQGSTLRAAMKAGREVIGIEIDEHYCELSAKSLEQNALPLE